MVCLTVSLVTTFCFHRLDNEIETIRQKGNPFMGRMRLVRLSLMGSISCACGYKMLSLVYAVWNNKPHDLFYQELKRIRKQRGTCNLSHAKGFSRYPTDTNYD